MCQIFPIAENTICVEPILLVICVVYFFHVFHENRIILYRTASIAPVLAVQRVGQRGLLVIPLFSGCVNFSENKCDSFGEYLISLAISLMVSRALRKNTSFLATSCKQAEIEEVDNTVDSICSRNLFLYFGGYPISFYLACSLRHQTPDLYKVIEGGYNVSAYPELLFD